jgi:predicted nucleic acid-binding OB-fold protein
MVKEKRYEEYAYILDFMPKGTSKIAKNRKGPIVQAVGEEYFILLELLASDDASFKIGERIYVGKEKMDKILSVLGKLSADDLTESKGKFTKQKYLCTDYKCKDRRLPELNQRTIVSMAQAAFKAGIRISF